MTLTGVSFAKTSTSVASTAINIRINVAYSANSHWSESEIYERFEAIKDSFKNACSDVNLILNELVRIEDKELQDIDGSLTPQSANQIKRVLSLFKDKIHPVLLYVRQGKWDFENQNDQHFTDSISKAYMFGGPRLLPNLELLQWNDPRIKENSVTGWEMGNLDWNRYEELKPLQGVVLIGQANSFKDLQQGLHGDLTNLDRHELGHVLLNDGSHRNTVENFMSDDPNKRHGLDPDQCEIIRSYNILDSLRDINIKYGMAQLCLLYKRKGILNQPSYCIEK